MMPTIPASLHEAAVEAFGMTDRSFEDQYVPGGGNWGGTSGAGSNPHTTVPYRAFLESFIGFNAVRSIVDVGCGDWQFSRFLNLDGIDYLGLDVVPSVIDANRARHSRASVRFDLMPSDIATIPGGDLLIMKDVLQHLGNAKIIDFRDRLFPKYKYCLLTNSFTKLDTPTNTDIEDANFRCLDLSAAPFHLDGAYVLEFGSPLWERIRTYLHTPGTAAAPSLKAASQSLVFMQTADAEIYKAILDVSSIPNIEYCSRHGFRYESYIGIKHGVVPWMASYNRLFMLHELVERGHRNWVLFADADAFVVDLNFDVMAYLEANREYCLIGASGGSSTPWDLNSGILFINLGDPTGRAFVSDWLARFQAEVPLHYLANSAAKWDEFPNDQDIMYRCIQYVPGLLAKTKREEERIYNYHNGRFMLQAIRVGNQDISDRIQFIESKTKQAM